MKKNCLTLLFLASTFITQAQVRSFIDAPSFYVFTNDVGNAINDAGAAIDFGYGIGTHNLMLKASLGLMASTDFESGHISESIFFNPFGRLEAGVGMWRTNNSKCGKREQTVLTLLAKAGIFYGIGSKEENTELLLPAKSSGLDYYIGAELAVFRLLDYRRNTEFFLDGGYSLDSKSIHSRFGFRVFFNTRE